MRAFINSLKLLSDTFLVIRTIGVPLFTFFLISGVKCSSLNPKPTTRKLFAFCIIILRE
jgi:hypothetical protein